jgi:hypothetical protein
VTLPPEFGYALRRSDHPTWIKSSRDDTAKEFCDCGKETCVTCQMLMRIWQAEEEAKRAREKEA